MPEGSPVRPPARRLPTRVIVAIALIAGNAFAHRGWFRQGPIAFGDWHYMVGRTIVQYFRLPSAWDATTDFGLRDPSLQGYPFLLAIGAVGRLGGQFDVAERVIFFFPFIVAPVLSMAALTRRFTTSAIAAVVAAGLFALNSYALLIGNNQLTVAMAYALSPWLVARGMDLGRSVGRADWVRTARDTCAFVLVTAVSTIYEPRVTLLGLVVAGGALVVCASSRGVPFRRLALVAFGLASSMVATQVYWLVVGVGGSGYVGDLLPEDPFISFSTVTHALNLNHPFWTTSVPGIFTREAPLVVLFLVPLLLAIALASVGRHDRRLLYLAAVSLVGAFLVKGENPPFARVYGFAFDHVPGMRFYRDMSKFMMWTALGYAVLVGVFATRAWTLAQRGTLRARVVGGVGLVAVASVTLVPALPALTQRQGGTFAASPYPGGLRAIHEVLEADQTFGRVVWMAYDEPYLYRSPAHPGVRVSSAMEALAVDRAEELSGASHLRSLGSMGVEYIVTGRELNVFPGTTDEERRDARADTLRNLSEGADALSDGDGFRIFRLRSSSPLWSTGDSCSRPDPVGVAPDEAAITGSASRRTAVVYRQRFDPGWTLAGPGVAGREAEHRRTQDGFNCWEVAGLGAGDLGDLGDLEARFDPDRQVVLGALISVGVLAAMALAAAVLSFRLRRSEGSSS